MRSKGATLALTLRASSTDFSLPKPTLQAIRPCTSNAWKPSERKPQIATFYRTRSALSDRHPTGANCRDASRGKIAAKLAAQVLPPAFSRNGLIRSTGNTIVVDCKEPSASNVCR
jgi:hypothetical protein